MCSLRRTFILCEDNQPLACLRFGVVSAPYRFGNDRSLAARVRQRIGRVKTPSQILRVILLQSL